MDIIYELIYRLHKDTSRLLTYYELQKEPKESTITILTENFSGGRGGEEMPPKYADGTTRKIRKSGLLQYSFYYNGKQYPVYGYSQKEVYANRFIKEIELATAKTPQKEKPITQKKEIDITYKEWAEIWLKEKNPNAN